MARINLHQVQLAEFESQLTELEVTELNDTELQSISGGIMTSSQRSACQQRYSKGKGTPWYAYVLCL